MPSIDDYYEDFKETKYTKNTFIEQRDWLVEYVELNKPTGLPVLEDRKRIHALNKLIEEM
jgi:hypothetical protein